MTRVGLLVLALAAGCGRSTEPRYRVLFADGGGEVSLRELRVEVSRPTLPRYLDRAQIVRHVSAARLELSGDELWGSPLDRMVGDTLAENLAQRLPGGAVFTEQGAITIEPDVRVETDFQRFGLDRDGRVSLSAQVALHFRDGPSRIDPYLLSGRPADAGVEAAVAELSHLLGQLATLIARCIVDEGSPAGTRSE